MPGYPSEYELDALLRDGSMARFRPIKETDAAEAKLFFERLGPESRYFRFFKIRETLTDEEITHFTHVDYSDRMAIVCVQEGSVVGVGRYDREDPGGSTAEVAFAVVDDHQGRGIGTQILQLLTRHARENGVERFRAFVLGENRQMMRVFRNSGYELTRTIDRGVFTVDFPISASEDSLAAEAEREKRAVAASLLPLFFPKSIAVIGASNNPDSIGGKLFTNLLAERFTGPLYPVNPTSKVVQSVRAYSSILDVPDIVDLAFIAVPERFVLDVARQCAEKGVRGVVVISAGFSEVGEEGAAKEKELLQIVRSSGMRMVGPNCMGLLNTASNSSLNGTFGPVFPPAGNIAMSSQSGALGIAILDYATRNNIGISQFVSVGNKADVSANDLILSWEDDPETDVITLYVESFGNPRKFSRIARRIGRTKPIIAVKSGRTAAGSRAASSHTGALASSDTAVRALFTQAGVIRVDTIEELFDVANLLASQPIPEGKRVGVLTNAGGPGILAADALEDHGLQLPVFSDDLQARIGSILPAEATTKNPVDLIASGGPPEFAHATREILASGEVDALMVIFVPTSPEGAYNVADALRACQDPYDGPVTLMSVFMDATGAGTLRLAGDGAERPIPTYLFPEHAALALARAVRHGEWRRRDPGEESTLEFEAVDTIRRVVDDALGRLGPEGGWLEADEVDACLNAAGLPTPQTAIVQSRNEAIEVARRIEGPVAIKVLSESALHKSDVGGVVLDLEGDRAVGEAYDQVVSAVDEHDGVLVQEYVGEGHEVLIGMAQDPNFGPLVGVGLGGIYVELLKDVSLRIHPITDTVASEMIRETRASRLLAGYRNQPSGDVAALEDALQRISGLITTMPELVEMDLNPVKVKEPGEGICVVDARMRVEPVPPEMMPGMKDLPGVANRPTV